jgi:hypothetical protein
MEIYALRAKKAKANKKHIARRASISIEIMNTKTNILPVGH